MRVCLDCGKSIDHCYRTRLRCDECRVERNRQRYHENKEQIKEYTMRRRSDQTKKLLSFEIRKDIEKELGIKQFKQAPHKDEA